VSDHAVPWRVFLGVAAFVAVLGVLYWFVTYEDAGTTLLALASALGLFFGGYLFLQDRRRTGDARPHDEPPAEEHYLPESSIWPFGIGVGLFLAFNGLILGLAWTLPGAVLVATSVGGFVRQSRQRA
jgi:Cytochrome c oxidase subunit IV